MAIIDVAAGILLAEDRVLISERQGDPSFVGLWEFPGGKIDAGETAVAALRRELEEELGILVRRERSFTTLKHQYSDRYVRIEFFLVTEWLGKPRGREGQALRWVRLNELQAADLLPADAPLIAALQAM